MSGQNGGMLSAHHWARHLVELGHTVRLIPPQYVTPYVKRNKTDAADAEAICEAVARPNMRFVLIKTKEQQAILALHRVRSLTVRQRTAAINALRGLMGEFGLVAGKGIRQLGQLSERLAQADETVVPLEGREAIRCLLMPACSHLGQHPLYLTRMLFFIILKSV
jgi:transposase